MLKLAPEAPLPAAAQSRKKASALVTSSFPISFPIAICDSMIPGLNGALLSVCAHDEAGAVSRVRLPCNSHFQLLPNPREDRRDTFGVFGPSGSGKSTLAAQFCRKFCALFPASHCFLICGASGDKDPAFSDLFASGKMRQIPLAMLDGLELETAFPEKCCVVVDDIESSNKRELCEIERVQKGLLCLGRKPCWTTLILGHVACDGSRGNRYVLAESDNIVIFPRVSMAGQINYLCERRLGLTKEQIKELRHLPSRWVCIRKGNTPGPIAIAETEAYAL